MGKAMDFEKLRRKRQRRVTARRLLILLGVACVVAGAVFVNNYLIDVGLTTRIRDVVESWGGSGYPVPTPGGVIREVKTFDGDLAVLNDTNLLLYNKKGKIISSFQQMQDSTVLICSGSRAFTYDIGGTRITVHARSRVLFEKELEYRVLAADMNGRGDFAVVTASRQYVAQVTVYDRKFEERFWWYSSDNLVSGVAVSPGGNRMAVSCVNTQGGLLKTTLYLFDFSQETELKKTELAGDLALSIAYQPDGRFSLLTDRQYILYSGDGEQQAAYDFGGRELLAVERAGGKALLLLGDEKSEKDRRQHLVLLDSQGGEETVLSLSGKVRDVALGGQVVYLLTAEGVKSYSHELERQNAWPAAGVTGIHLIGDTLYLFTQDEINVLSGK